MVVPQITQKIYCNLHGRPRGYHDSALVLAAMLQQAESRIVLIAVLVVIPNGEDDFLLFE